MDGVVELHSSWQQTLMRCPRKAHLSLHFQPVRPHDALSFGTTFHRVMELLDARGLSKAEAVRRALEEYPLTKVELTPEGGLQEVIDEEAVKLLGGMADYWVNYWLEAPENAWYRELETVATEVEFRIPLASGVVFEGRIDRIAKDAYDQYYVIDYKTFKQLPPDHWVQNSPQFTNYLIAASNLLGTDVDNFLVVYFRKENPMRGLRRLKDGGFSTNKSQRVSPLVARAQLAAAGEDLDDPRWRSFVTYDPEHDPFVVVKRAHRSRIQRRRAWSYLVAAGEKLRTYAKDRHFELLGLREPNFQYSCVWDCEFHRVCQMYEDGADWYDYLANSGEFIVRSGA